MNINDLRVLLREKESDPAGFRILEAPDEGTWCIRKQGKAWLVFYFERGSRWELERFKTESSACEYFLDRVCRG